MLADIIEVNFGLEDSLLVLPGDGEHILLVSFPVVPIQAGLQPVDLLLHQRLLDICLFTAHHQQQQQYSQIYGHSLTKYSDDRIPNPYKLMSWISGRYRAGYWRHGRDLEGCQQNQHKQQSMLLKDSSRSLNKREPVSRTLKPIYASNAPRITPRGRQQLPPPLNVASPKNRSSDFYSFQKSMFRSKPIRNSQAFRNTFSIQKDKSPRLSSSDSKRVISSMLNTTSNFRPPTHSMRRCVDEQQKNYLSRYEIMRELGKGTYGVVHLAKKKDQGEGEKKRDQSEPETLILSTVSLEGQNNEEQNEAPIYQSIRSVGENKEIDKEDTQREDAQREDTTLMSPEDSAPKNKPQDKQAEKCPDVQDNKSEETLYAIKVYEKFKMNKDPSKFKNIRKEINIMQNIEHPNIIKLYESVDTLTKISLVVEYGGDSSLLDYLKANFPLSDSLMRRICRQLLSAINYLHEKNIVHRDIKLQNVLMRGHQVKLIDFGFGTLTYRNRKLNAICGTPNYMAPEILSRKEYVGEQADIWSFGVVAYTIGEGRHPFKAETYNELERLVNKGQYQFKRITNPVQQAFVRRILKIKPHERPRASELLLHPWLCLED